MKDDVSGNQIHLNDRNGRDCFLSIFPTYDHGAVVKMRGRGSAGLSGYEMELSVDQMKTLIRWLAERTV